MLRAGRVRCKVEVGPTLSSRMPSAISRIDHVRIYADRPDQVFRFFTDDLCLPVAFPLATHPSYTTGSIALGNCFLEITKLGSPPRPGSASVTARYQILGFQAADDVGSPGPEPSWQSASVVPCSCSSASASSSCRSDGSRARRAALPTPGGGGCSSREHVN